MTTCEYHMIRAIDTIDPMNRGLKQVSPDKPIVDCVDNGEMGCTSFVPSFYIREIVKVLLDCGTRPFLTDSGVLYLGKRRNARDHVMTAHANGFTLATTGAPIIIADGLLGSDVEEITIDGRYYKSVDVVGAIAHADSLVVVSHVTGHGLMGFAGAFKNLGMGAVGRNVKLSVHELVKPSVDSDRCDACASSCLKSCPADAISIDRNSKSAVIDLGPCIGCGECLTVCPNEAIQIEWKGDSTRAQQKLVEAASAVMRQKAGSICYFNFLLNITPSCDCFQRSAAPMVPDIGLLASLDPVAIDQASVDFTLKTTSARDDRYTDPSLRFLPVGGGSWDSAFDYAEALGLGSRSYKLIPL